VGWYCYRGLDRGWVPHDEGQFAQSAARILAGDIPHRDFDEMYTGGLSYVNAAAFRLMGQDLRSLRLVLFGMFLLWVPAVYYIASKFGPPLMAGAVTMVAVVWCIPNYPSPVPSWYNLFLAAFGLAALLRFVETDRRRWLFAAGLCGGLSFLVKLVGVYFIVGAFLFLVFEEQRIAWSRASTQTRPSPAYFVAVSCGLVAFVALLLRAFWVGLTAPRLIAILLPVVAVAAILLRREARRLPGSSWVRLRTLVRLATPLVAGVALPVALFVALFAVRGGLAPFYQDVFVLPQRRLTSASYTMPSFDMWLTVPLLIIPGALLASRRALHGLVMFVVTAVMLAVVLIASRTSVEWYQLAWRPAVYMLALGSMAAIELLGRVDVPPDRRHQQAAAVVFVTATCGLVQLPFPAPIYFCYVAPLVVLAMCALLSVRRPSAHAIATALLVFYGLFVALRVTPGYIYAMGNTYAADGLTSRLFLPRARTLKVDPAQTREYDQLVPLVSQLARGGALYAGPDCPEVYFLTGMPNPTRTIYEFLSEPRPTTADILSMLARQHVTVVVINTTPEFSGPMPADLRDALRARYPETKLVGPFEVRWVD
jgi:hypothetical protein